MLSNRFKKVIDLIPIDIEDAIDLLSDRFNKAIDFIPIGIKADRFNQEIGLERLIPILFSSVQLPGLNVR